MKSSVKEATQAAKMSKVSKGKKNPKKKAKKALRKNYNRGGQVGSGKAVSMAHKGAAKRC